MRGPIGCVAAVTYRCNSRCAMCDIWKQVPGGRPELSAEDYRWLPASLRSINVSGGEPFLRDDLPDVVRVMREACPRARVVISTNGLATDRIVAAVARMGDVAVRVSVDGVGEPHDTLRGVHGAYDRALDTVRLLKGRGITDLGIAATSTESTIGELTKVEALARTLRVGFVASAAHSSPIFFGAHDAERPRSSEAAEEIAGIMRRNLRSPRPSQWAKAYYMRGLIDYVQRRPRRLACGAGVDHFFVDPWGDVYPCNIGGTRMGNVRDGSFEEIAKRSAAAVAAAVAECREQCWMVCTVTPPMRRRPVRPVMWVAGAKLLGVDTAVPGGGPGKGRTS